MRKERFRSVADAMQLWLTDQRKRVSAGLPRPKRLMATIRCDVAESGLSCEATGVVRIMIPSPGTKPAARGAALALLAAALFGVSTPLVQHFGTGLGPFTTAALLYIGCAAVALALRSPASREARLRRSDAPRLLAMAGLGAVVGSVALAWGLQNTSGASASLMLTLEAVFTAVLAWYLYREVLDRRVVVAMALLTAGGAVLVIGQGLAGQAQMLGLLAVLIATAAWGRQRPVTRRC